MTVSGESHNALIDWLGRLSELMSSVEAWAVDLGWTTRRIELTRQDSLAGTYLAPALLLQDRACRILVEPITHRAPGVDGVVDLYAMPAYDDIATLYLLDGQWSIVDRDSATGAVQDADQSQLTAAVLGDVLAKMKQHAPQPV